MRADRTFTAMGVIALLALALPAVLAIRLLPIAVAEAFGSSVPHGPGLLGAACSRLFTLVPGGAATVAVVVGGLLAASVACAVWLAWRQWRTGAKLAAAIRAACRPLPPPLVRQLERLGLAGRVDLVASARPAAFTYGLWTPRVCITTGLTILLQPDEVDAVLRHERHHVVRRDPLRLLWARVLAAGAFFVPALRDVQTHGLTLLELAADDAAVAPPHGPRPLARALYALLRVRSDEQDKQDDPGVPPWRLAEGAVGFGPQPREVLDARIDHLLDPKASLPVAWSPLRVLVTAAFFGGAVCLLLYL